MMERKVCFLSVLAAAALFSGCSDESYSGAISLQPCSNEGEVICSQSGGLLTCKDGFYSPSMCSDGMRCVNGECVNACTPESFPIKCSGEDSRYVCGSEGVVTTEKCEEGNICHEGYCRDKSLEKCDNTYAQQCRDDSTWTQCLVGYVVSHKCPEGQACDDGICSSAEKCDSELFDATCKSVNTQVICSNGHKKEVNCGAGTMCVNGECTSSCSGDVKICSADRMTSYTCQDGTLQPTICTGSSICKDGECVGQSDCNPAQYSATCREGKVVKCSPGGQVVEEECSAGLECFAGACVSDAPCDVKTMTPVCLSSTSLQSCSGNGSKERTNCEAGETCENGICQKFEEACETGAKVCVSASIARECIDGFWHSKYCDLATEVCSNDACMDKTEATTCANGTPALCNGNTVYVCENGYLSKKDCASGQHCDAGKCYDDIKVGDSCNSVTFVQQCLEDGKLAICENGVIISTGCGEGVCKAGACTDSACDAATFAPECRGDFEITTCDNGVTKKVSCGTNMHCSNNQCVPDATEGDPCTPGSFTASCNNDGKRVTCEQDADGSNTVHLSECSGNLPFCMNGDCVACDPATYGTTCSNGHKYTCSATGSLVDGLCPTDYVCYNNDCAQCDPTAATKTCTNDTTQHICNASGSYEDKKCPDGYTCSNGECTNTCATDDDCQKADSHYFCDNGQCKFKADCALTDPAVCDGNKIRSCKTPGIYDYQTCAANETCKLNSSNVPECIGTECDPETYGTQCGSGNKIMICDKGYLREQSACTGSDVCKNGKCMGNECDPDTYAAQCDSDGKTPKYCDNGYIKTRTACDGVCIGGSCFDCDHEKTPVTCKTDRKYKVVCNENNTYELQTCDAGFECQDGKGCVNKCGEGFVDSCNNLNQRVWCDDGTIKTNACDFRSECVAGKCDSKEGKACIPVVYENICHNNGGSPVLESCNPTTKKVEFSSCTGAGQFCGTIKGLTECYSTCTEAEVTSDVTWCTTTTSFDQKIGKCVAGKDYLGNSRYGITRDGALCEHGNSKSCRVSSHNNHIVFDYIPCHKMGNTCSGTNGSCGFASCSAKSASCSGTVANNCMNDPSVGGLVQTSMDCAAVGGSCVVINPDGIERALCDVTVSGLNSTPSSVSSLGTCSGKTLFTLYWPEGEAANHYTWHQFECNTACKTATTTYAGKTVTYSYCE